MHRLGIDISRTARTQELVGNLLQKCPLCGTMAPVIEEALPHRESRPSVECRDTPPRDAPETGRSCFRQADWFGSWLHSFTNPRAPRRLMSELGRHFEWMWIEIKRAS